MADRLFPVDARISSARWDLISNTAISRSIFTGAARSVGRTGDRLRVSVSIENASNRESLPLRAALRALRAELRGQANRCNLSIPGYERRGSFEAPELIPNNTFASGTAGWGSGSSSVMSISVADRRMRCTRVDGVTSTTLRRTVALTCVQYAPYVARAFITAGRGPLSVSCRLGTTGGGNDIATTGTLSAGGLLTSVGVTWTTSPFFNIADLANGKFPADFMEASYTSVSRCALVDNLSNLLLRSIEFSNSSWGKVRSSVVADAVAAPDGATTADTIIEDGTASNTHYVSQAVTVSSSVGWHCFAVALKAGARTWARLMMRDNVDANDAMCYFDLANGALGTASLVGSVAWSDVRGAISSLGNGWYYCAVLARKINAATSITQYIHLSTGDGTVTYSGDGTSNIYAWGATRAGSGVPMRLCSTSEASAVPDTPQVGSGLHTKGWPASTQSLLLPGDSFEIITTRGSELKLVTAAVHSDAAGLAYVQFEPPLRGQPAADAPIIVNQPMGRFILMEPEGGWDDATGGFSNFDFMFEEALD